MVGHLACTEVTGDDVPASLNPKIVTDVLRDQLGYDGVIITDSLQMGAVAGLYSSSDIGVRALLAGDDMKLMADESLYNDSDKFNQCLTEYNALARKIPALEQEWLELSEKIEEGADE